MTTGPPGATGPGAAAPVVVTIGVYGFDAASFVRRLHEADVRVLLDVRQRRGVRGQEYAWANARRLQWDVLSRAGVDYEHHPRLAPTTELRRLQYAEDDLRGVGKRSREELAREYVRRYTAEVLDTADLAPVVATASEVAASAAGGAVALLCVERDPQACHRSLIARRLHERHGVRIGHLLPP